MEKPYKKWQETTKRKGANKICRDMFIADSNGNFTFCEVKNGKLVAKKPIERDLALKCIDEDNLVGAPSILSNCSTYRTAASNDLISSMLAQS